MLKCIIVDLDGTLANVDHRLHLIKRDKPDWDAFNKASIDDIAYPNIVELVNSLSQSCYVIICTGRNNTVELETMGWLDNNEIKYHKLLMRKDGDFRSDFVIKKEMLEDIQIYYQIIVALDDRDGVVQMYRDNDITCLQVKRGDY